jgi:hypothetical protein
LVRFIPNRVNRHGQGEFSRLDLLEILLIIVAGLQNGKGARIADRTDIVEMRWLVGRLPFGRLESVQRPENDIDNDYDGKYESVQEMDSDGLMIFEFAVY